jgi:hypothetical protein
MPRSAIWAALGDAGIVKLQLCIKVDDHLKDSGLLAKYRPHGQSELSDSPLRCGSQYLSTATKLPFANKKYALQIG